MLLKLLQLPLINSLTAAPEVANDTTKMSGIDKLEKDLASADLSSINFEDLLNKFSASAIDFVLKIIIAVIVFYIGRYLISRLYKITKMIMIKREVEPSLSTFILSLLKISLLFLLIIIVIGIIGIETSSFIALFASAGVAIGMALSGTLQNFAGGVLILFIKPYKVGDFIEVQGYTGTVKEIQIFNTVINTPDNKSIIMPNGALSTGNINNYSKEDYRRVDWTVSIAYGDDFELAKKTVLELINADHRIVKKYIDDDRKKRKIQAPANTILPTSEVANTPIPEKKSLFRRAFPIHNKIKTQAQEWSISREKEVLAKIPRTDCSPVVVLGALADSSVNITIRVWTRSEFYWDVYFSMNQKIYTEFPKVGLNFPFPQMDVHLSKN